MLHALDHLARQAAGDLLVIWLTELFYVRDPSFFFGSNHDLTFNQEGITFRSGGFVSGRQGGCVVASFYFLPAFVCARGDARNFVTHMSAAVCLDVQSRPDRHLVTLGVNHPVFSFH